MIPASEPGSCSQGLSTIPVPTPVQRQIVGVVQRPRKAFEPGPHLLPVDVSHAKPLGAAVQLAVVLSGDNDAVRRLLDLNRIKNGTA